MTVLAVSMHGFGEETAVVDIDNELHPVPEEGLQILWIGPSIKLPDGTALGAGSGSEQHVWRQRQPEAAADPEWLGHRFPSVHDGNGGTYFTRRPPLDTSGQPGLP